VRLSSTAGVRHAVLNAGHGIVSANYGLGRTMSFAFDLSGTLRGASTLTAWNGVMQSTLQFLARTEPDDLLGGGTYALKATVSNTGTTPQALDYIAKVPSLAEVLGTAPAPTASTNEGGLPTLRWRIAPAGGASLALVTTLKAPVQEGNYVLSNQVNQVNANHSSTLLQSSQVALNVRGPASLADATVSAVQALSLPAAEAAAKTAALAWLAKAQMAVGDSNWNDALRHLIAAQSALQGVTGAVADDARLALARTIAAVERRL
jgi:hypothetical protein